MKIGRLWNDLLDLRRNKVLNDDLVTAIMVKYIERCFEHIDNKRRANEMAICSQCKRRPEEMSLF